MPTWNIGDCLHGFRVERKDILPHLNAHYWKLTHEKTGAALYYSDRDDGQMVFSVGFRTLLKAHEGTDRHHCDKSKSDPRSSITRDDKHRKHRPKQKSKA